MTITATKPTTEQVEQKVREFAALAPDFVYTPDEIAIPRCKYRATDGNPLGCIVGAAFRDLGYSVDSETLAVGDVLFGLEMDDSYWLGLVQDEQDGGKSWGEAVAIADRRMATR